MRFCQLYQFGPEWHLNCHNFCWLLKELIFLEFFWEWTLYLSQTNKVLCHTLQMRAKMVCACTQKYLVLLGPLYCSTLVFFLRSEAKENFCCVKAGGVTSKSVSSLINTVSMDSADSIAFWTINRSTSAWSWKTWQLDLWALCKENQWIAVCFLDH